MEWYWKLIYMAVGVFIGVLGAGICAMMACNDCAIIERIRRVGK
jgi:hypothetical protein